MRRSAVSVGTHRRARCRRVPPDSVADTRRFIAASADGVYQGRCRAMLGREVSATESQRSRSNRPSRGRGEALRPLRGRPERRGRCAPPHADNFGVSVFMWPSAGAGASVVLTSAGSIRRVAKEGDGIDRRGRYLVRCSGAGTASLAGAAARGRGDCAQRVELARPGDPHPKLDEPLQAAWLFLKATPTRDRRPGERSPKGARSRVPAVKETNRIVGRRRPSSTMAGDLPPRVYRGARA